MITNIKDSVPTLASAAAYFGIDITQAAFSLDATMTVLSDSLQIIILLTGIVINIGIIYVKYFKTKKEDITREDMIALKKIYDSINKENKSKVTTK